MMASAAARQLPAAPCDTSEARTLVILSAGSGSPITPVEAMKTSCGRQRALAAASAAMARPPSCPNLPVKALALPLLTTSTRASPPLSLSRHHKTGADDVLEVVKTPAAWV